MVFILDSTHGAQGALSVINMYAVPPCFNEPKLHHGEALSWASGLGWGGGGLLLLFCALEEYCGGGAAKTGPRSTKPWPQDPDLWTCPVPTHT
jgi:hypothetical protein